MDGVRNFHGGPFGTSCIGGLGGGEVQEFSRRRCKSRVWIRCHRRVSRGREGSQGQGPGTGIYQAGKDEAPVKVGREGTGREAGGDQGRITSQPPRWRRRLEMGGRGEGVSSDDSQAREGPKCAHGTILIDCAVVTIKSRKDSFSSKNTQC